MMLPVLLVVAYALSASAQTMTKLCDVASRLDPAANATQHCSSSPITDIDVVKAHAHRFAPYLYFHPLEPYYPASIPTFLNHSRIYTADGVDLGPADENNLLIRSQQKDALLQYVSIKADPQFEQLKAGDSFDQYNRSTAPVYYNAFQTDRGTWVYNYGLFFAWNGCSNQNILQQLSDSAGQQQLQYIACHLGEHEGDIEHVTVEVCGDLSTVLRVQLSQHGWGEDFNCVDPGYGCVLQNGTNPVAYVSLNSHAMYSLPTFDLVYLQTKVDAISSIRALSLVDRTTTGGKSWVPDQSRLVFLERAGNLTTAQQFYELRQASSDPVGSWVNNSWLAFGGRWGVAFSSELKALDNPTCLFNNQSTIGACPNSVILNIVQLLLGATQDNSFRSSFGFALQFISPFLSTSGPTGFRDKDWYTAIESQDKSPIVKSGKPVVCPDYAALVPFDDNIDSSTGSSDVPMALIITLSAIFLGCAVGLVALTMLGRRYYWNHHKCSPYEHKHHVMPSLLSEITRSLPILSVWATIMLVVGYIILIEGIEDSFDIMNRYVRSPVWDNVRSIMRVCVPLILVVDSVVLFFSFFGTGKTFEYFCLHKHARCHDFLKSRGWILQTVLIAIQLVSNLINLTLFAYTMVVLGVQLVFLDACSRTETFRVGICINLGSFGIDNVFCGRDISQFCDLWGAITPKRTLVGATLVNIAQWLFLVQSGIMFYRLFVFKKLDRAQRRAKEAETRQAAAQEEDRQATYMKVLHRLFNVRLSDPTRMQHSSSSKADQSPCLDNEVELTRQPSTSDPAGGKKGNSSVPSPNRSETVFSHVKMDDADYSDGSD